MHKVIHKLIHYRDGGINVIAEVNAAISTGDGQQSYSSAHSYSSIVQRNGSSANESQPTQSNEKEVNDGKES